jgi:GH18 family chitinase
MSALIKIKKIEFDNFSDIIFNFISIENPTHQEEIKKLQQQNAFAKIPVIVRNFNLNIDKGDLNFKAKLDSWINLWLRVGGDISQDKKNQTLTFHVKKAKLGIFSVRGTLLKMARKLKMDNLSVQGNKIILSLK